MFSLWIYDPRSFSTAWACSVIECYGAVKELHLLLILSREISVKCKVFWRLKSEDDVVHQVVSLNDRVMEQVSIHKKQDLPRRHSVFEPTHWSRWFSVTQINLSLQETNNSSNIFISNWFWWYFINACKYILFEMLDSELGAEISLCSANNRRLFGLCCKTELYL